MGKKITSREVAELLEEIDPKELVRQYMEKHPVDKDSLWYAIVKYHENVLPSVYSPDDMQEIPFHKDFLGD